MVPNLAGGNLAVVAIVPFVLGLLVSAVSPQTDFTVAFMWLLYAFAVLLIAAGVAVWYRSRR